MNQKHRALCKESLPLVIPWPSPWVCRFRWHGSCSCAPETRVMGARSPASSLRHQASPSIHLVDCDIAEIGFLHETHLIESAWLSRFLALQ